MPFNTPSGTKDCQDCDWWKKITQPGGFTYVGDPPCTWCNKGRVVNLTGVDTLSVKDYTTPCVNTLDSTLSSTSSGSTNIINNKRDKTND